MYDSNWRRIYPADIDIVEVESLNATLSDLPGPGRVLGNLYARCGQMMEKRLSCLAERFALGPPAVIERIEGRLYQGRLRVHDFDSDGRVIYIGKEENDQRKDLKRLIRYAQLVICRYHVFRH